MSLPQKLTEPSGREAELYRVLPSGRVQCTACARLCQIGEGQVGLCGIRGVVGGKLYLLVYGKIIAGHVDPIEKKPVVHYRPGSKIFSIATTGCNWLCRYCFSPETPILTDRGILPISSIFDSSNPADEVGYPISVRVLSHTGQWRNVAKAFRHKYDGKMLSIRPYYLPEIRCTPNHKIFVSDSKSGQLVERRADQLMTNDLLAIPRPHPGMSTSNVDPVQALNVAVAEATPTGVRKQSWQLVYDDETVRFQMSRGRGIPRRIHLNDGFAELLGLYCAEGSCIRFSSRPNSWVVTLSFGKHETDLIERAATLLWKVFGARPGKITQGSVTRLVVYNNALGMFLNSVAGGDCYNKMVPDFILLNRSESLKLSFLEGYIRGDGYMTGSRNQKWLGTTSVSRELALGVWYMMFQLGFAPKFYTANNPSSYEIEQRTVTRHNDYMTRLMMGANGLPAYGRATKMKETGDYLLVPVRAISEHHYSGFVYNLEVEDDHSYTAGFVTVSNCQNSDISQRRKVEGTEASPDEVISMAKSYGCEGLAYTYNQPTIFMEYARDVGEIARSKGLFNIFVSNGYDTPETVGLMDSFLDCITVDFKGSGEREFVRKYIGIPDPGPIFRTLLDIKEKTKVHVEITDLIVPKVGDSLEAAAKLCRWVYDNLGPDTPVHFLRFHPDYKMMDFPSTPVETLEKHHAVGKRAGLNYVYVGNVPGHPAENTYCPGCKAVLVKRFGYEILEYNLDGRDRCRFCGQQTPIVGPLSRSFDGDRFIPVIS